MDLGVALDVPLGHKDAAFVRSHFDGMEVRVADAPRANEIMVAVAVTDSGRPLPRVGGLKKDEIKGDRRASLTTRRRKLQADRRHGSNDHEDGFGIIGGCDPGGSDWPQASPRSAQDTIKIGEINSYSGLPSFTEPYRKGWQLALEKSMPPAASTARSSKSFPRTTAVSRPTR